jgi:hypothetical protein
MTEILYLFLLFDVLEYFDRNYQRYDGELSLLISLNMILLINPDGIIFISWLIMKLYVFLLQKYDYLFNE